MEPNVAKSSRRSSFATSAGGLAVYPLWKGAVEDALRAFDLVRPKLSRKLGVAAVLPDQSLDLNEMDALEEAGLLVVEVPQGLRTLAEVEVAEYVERQIDGPESMAIKEDCAFSTAQFASSTNSVPVSSDLTDLDEEALLKSINDPEADEGGA